MRAYDPKIPCPSFSLGMSFSSAKEFQQVVAKYSIVNGHGLRFKKNEPNRITVVCEEGCPFKIYVS